MEKIESEMPIADEVEREIKRFRPLQRLFMLDVLGDPESRPVFYWAGGALLVGVLFYHWAEGWSYLDALYFCFVSLATVGYGDLTPTSPLARAFTIIYLVNGIGILLALFDRVRIVRTRSIENLAQRKRESKPTRDDIGVNPIIADNPAIGADPENDAGAATDNQ